MSKINMFPVNTAATVILRDFSDLDTLRHQLSYLRNYTVEMIRAYI